MSDDFSIFLGVWFGVPIAVSIRAEQIPFLELSGTPALHAPVAMFVAASPQYRGRICFEPTFVVSFLRKTQLLVIFALFTCFYVVEERFAMIVERFGQFSRLCPPGLHFLVPFVDRPRPLLWRSTEVILSASVYGTLTQRLKINQASITKIDMRENIMDFPNQVSQPNARAAAMCCRNRG
jgi:hypothetical protein